MFLVILLKIFLKVCMIIGLSVALSACDNEENEMLVNRVNHLEEKIDTLLEQNGINSNDITNNDTVINDGEGSTTVDTSEIEKNLDNYQTEANDISTDIDNLKVSSNRSETINLFFKWKATIEELDTKLDYYENELESLYLNNELSYSDYRKYDREIEDIENILDKAENNLEYKTNYDD